MVEVVGKPRQPGRVVLLLGGIHLTKEQVLSLAGAPSSHVVESHLLDVGKPLMRRIHLLQTAEVEEPVDSQLANVGDGSVEGAGVVGITL